MSYEANSDDDTDDATFVLDALELKNDPNLLHFFQSIEELIGHGKREQLLLSCLAYAKQVDQKMYDESKKPVYQKPKTDKKKETISDGISNDSNASSPSNDVNSLKSPTSASASSFNQLSSQITSPLNRDSAQAALIAAKQQDSRQAELIAAKKRELKKQEKDGKKWFQWGNKNNNAKDVAQKSSQSSTKSPTGSSKQSSGHSAKSPANSNKHSPPAAVPTSPISGQSTLASFPTDHTGASPITLLITNLAVYVLPPAIGLSDGDDTKLKYFLILNQYYRISLHDLCLISLPYRSGISLTGGDFALRINDFCLHLRSGLSVWLQSPRGRRSAVIEALSDAYAALMNPLHIQMCQPDYSELIGAIVQKTINHSIKRMRMESWAVEAPKMEGWLVHRAVQEHTSTNNVKQEQSDRWTTRWFILTSDDYLLQFDSPAELEAFRTIVTSQEAAVDLTDFGHEDLSNTNPQSKKQSALISKLPAHFDFIDIDLTRAVIRASESSDQPATGAKKQLSAFDVLVFPRNEATGSPIFDQDYTRHLFTVVPPIDSSISIINQSTSQSIIQSINQLYAKRPTVKIPLTQNDAIVPPSPASAKHADADKNRTEQMLNQQAAEIESLNQSMKFFPVKNQHPFGSLTFTQTTIDTMYELTKKWFDSIGQAIHLSSMGGTRSASDSQGARAAMKKHGYHTQSPVLRQTSDVTISQQPELGNGLFTPMIPSEAEIVKSVNANPATAEAPIEDEPRQNVSNTMETAQMESAQTQSAQIVTVNDDDDVQSV